MLIREMKNAKRIWNGQIIFIKIHLATNTETMQLDNLKGVRDAYL